eukprot:s1226_g30.t1
MHIVELQYFGGEPQVFQVKASWRRSNLWSALSGKATDTLELGPQNFWCPLVQKGTKHLKLQSKPELDHMGTLQAPAPGVVEISAKP